MRLSADIEIASQLLDEQSYGELSAAVAEIERSNRAERVRV